MQEARGPWAQLAEDASHSDVAHWRRPLGRKQFAQFRSRGVDTACIPALLDGRDHPDAVEQIRTRGSIYIYNKGADIEQLEGQHRAAR